MSPHTMSKEEQDLSLAQRIVLPGGAGLVGQNLVAHLKRLGYRDLIVLDKHRANLRVLQTTHPEITAIHADLAEPGDWERHFEGADAVVMLQAQIGGEDPVPYQRNNIDSTRHVLAAIAKYRIPYTVHISSSVLNSVADDLYTRTKREQERLIVASGIDAVVLRPTLMFGWFDRKHLGWLARFMKKVPIFPIPGHGRYMRQPLYAGDFARIIARCLQTRPTGQAYNITGLEQVDYIDIIRRIKASTNARCVILKIPYSLFSALLKIWAVFDESPPFTTAQLKALTAGDEFEVIDWPGIFAVTPTPFDKAVYETFNDPVYSKIVMEF
ncbi:MAG: NAD-dependent epimerase/dehydratase family protein [Burkholderiaceae bacterium]